MLIFCLFQHPSISIFSFGLPYIFCMPTNPPPLFRARWPFSYCQKIASVILLSSNFPISFDAEMLQFFFFPIVFMLFLFFVVKIDNWWVTSHLKQGKDRFKKNYQAIINSKMTMDILYFVNLHHFYIFIEKFQKYNGKRNESFNTK